MAEPNLATVLYTIPLGFLQVEMDESVTSRLGPPSGDNRADELIAALRIGRPVQAITSLSDGRILFALGISTK